MNDSMQSVLLADVFASRRKDEAIERGALMNFFASAQLCTLAFVRDATEMSIPESYAVQGLAPWGQKTA